jgi:nucleoid-associated protein YgaU
MSKKSLFTTEEWQMIADGPEWVLAALAAADGNVALTVKAKEARTFKNTVKDYSSRSSLVKEVIADKLKPSKDVKGATLSDAETALEEINALLAAKMGQSDADAYRDFLKDVAESVAEAAGEGLLGAGKKLSKKEEKALKKIGDALKTKASKASKTGGITFKKKAPAAKKPAAKPVVKRPAAPARKAYGEPGAGLGKYIAQHKVESGDSLSYLAKKYYDSGSKENWMKIYEANKELIGDNPNMIKIGQVLKIPRL